MREQIFFLSFLILLGACSAPKPKEPPRILNFWTALAPGNRQLVRVVMDRPPCPVIETDAGPVPLNARLAPDREFPVQVCEASLPLETQKAIVNGASLPLIRKSPEKILIVGDTGCRLKAGGDGHAGLMQACNDPKAWPYARVAKSAADWKPDLVIHTGDYHYREAECPASDPSCAGATAGDNWSSWNEDAIRPAAPLLEAAPWIFARGNHESCERAGKGWMLLFEPTAHRPCDDRMERFRVEFPDRVFEVIDSNMGDHLGPSLARIPAAPGKFMWVASHRPFQTPGGIEKKYDVKVPPALNEPGAMSVVFAGHWHFLNLNTFTPPRAPEFIIGNGGTMLDDNKRPFKKEKGVKSVVDEEFGFVTMEKIKPGLWSLHLRGVDGKIKKQCEFREDVRKVSELKCAKSVPGGPVAANGKDSK